MIVERCLSELKALGYSVSDALALLKEENEKNGTDR